MLDQLELNSGAEVVEADDGWGYGGPHFHGVEAEGLELLDDDDGGGGGSGEA